MESLQNPSNVSQWMQWNFDVGEDQATNYDPSGRKNDVNPLSNGCLRYSFQTLAIIYFLQQKVP